MDEEQNEDRFGDINTEPSDDERVVLDESASDTSGENNPDGDDEQDEVVEIKEQPDPVYITGDARITSPYMSTFEYAAVIGEMAARIEQSDKSVISDRIRKICKDNDIDAALDIAEIALEDLQTPIPLCVQRQMAPNVYEVWQVRELTLPSQATVSGFDAASTDVMADILGDAETKLQILIRKKRVLSRF